jgi:sugar lactone lactonase YvrE
MNRYKNLIGNRTVVLFSLIVIIGCKQKDDQDEQNITSDTASELRSNDLYKSEIFTEPGGFPSGIEGPAVDANGILYVVNYEKPGTIGKVFPDGTASLFITLPEGSIGNGIRFNSKGEMLIADYTNHNILKVDMNTKEIYVYAHNDEMNQPNDIAISGDDILFASDPDWENSKGQLWRIDTDGNFTLLEGNMGTTNGVEVSPDDKTLYVNESIQRKIWAYDLSEEGDISNKRIFIQFDDHGMDGMRTDIKGNLFVTRHGKGTVVMISPEGEIIQEISLAGKTPSNIAFGGEKGKTAFVTLQDNGNIEKFEVEHAGREFQMKN